jgi:hypothetical protein
MDRASAAAATSRHAQFSGRGGRHRGDLDVGLGGEVAIPHASVREIRRKPDNVSHVWGALVRVGRP